MLKWFAENPCIEHPKLRALPLGPKFRVTAPFFGEDVTSKRDAFLTQAALSSSLNASVRKTGIILRLDVFTSEDPFYKPHSRIRTSYLPYIRHIADSLGTNSNDSEPQSYFTELLSTSHVWSPPGRGIDSHRTWEALLCGAIPIVLESTLSSVYEGLNVLSLRDFGDLTADLVIETASLSAFYDRSINIFSPLFCFYWLREIENARTDARKDAPVL